MVEPDYFQGLFGYTLDGIQSKFNESMFSWPWPVYLFIKERVPFWPVSMLVECISLWPLNCKFLRGRDHQYHEAGIQQMFVEFNLNLIKEQERIIGINHRVTAHFLACLDVVGLSKTLLVSYIWGAFLPLLNKLNDIFIATFIKPMNQSAK